MIEMLVVIAIIAILSTVLLASFSTLGEHGKKNKCKTNLKNLAQGVINKVGRGAYHARIQFHIPKMEQQCK